MKCRIEKRGPLRWGDVPGTGLSRFALVLGALVLCCASCVSQGDRILESRTDELALRARDLEGRLLLEEIKLGNGTGELRGGEPRTVELRAEAGQLRRDAVASPELASWSLGLDTWASRLAGDRAGMEAILVVLANRYAGETWTVLAEAMATLGGAGNAEGVRGNEALASLLALEARLVEREDRVPGLLHVLAARALAARGRYGEALAQWDALLLGAGDGQARAVEGRAAAKDLGELVRTEREQTLALADAGLKSSASLETFLAERLNLRDWWALVASETGLAVKLKVAAGIGMTGSAGTGAAGAGDGAAGPGGRTAGVGEGGRTGGTTAAGPGAGTSQAGGGTRESGAGTAGAAKGGSSTTAGGGVLGPGGGLTWEGLLEWLEKEKRLAPGFAGSEGELSRRDAAWFLFQLYRGLRKDRFVDERYRSWQAQAQSTPGTGGAAAGRSLIPDVEYRAWYYFAALICVERQFLQLPDGIRFYPDGLLNGKDALAAAKALDSQVR